MTSSEFSEDFRFLVELGRITDKTTWCGHSFEMKTLSTEEELAIASVISYYKGTVGEGKAAAAAAVAASLSSVNGIPFYPNLVSYETEANIRLRFSKVIQWPYSLVEHLFLYQFELVKRSNDAIEELKKKPLSPIGEDLDDIAEILKSAGFSQEGS